MTPLYYPISLWIIGRNLYLLDPISPYELCDMSLILWPSIDHKPSKASMSTHNIFPQESRNYFQSRINQSPCFRPARQVFPGYNQVLLSLTRRHINYVKAYFYPHRASIGRVKGLL